MVETGLTIPDGQLLCLEPCLSAPSLCHMRVLHIAELGRHSSDTGLLFCTDTGLLFGPPAHERPETPRIPLLSPWYHWQLCQSPSLEQSHSRAFPDLGLTTDQDLLLMQEGMLMRKVRSKSWKKLRYFRLQNDGMTVWHARQTGGSAKPSCDPPVITIGAAYGKGLSIISDEDTEELSHFGLCPTASLRLEAMSCHFQHRLFAVLPLKTSVIHVDS
ncbi:hypothetical protein P7K49_013640 [Saguinus oedipus]|uniref:PH domain-containing protein n=1 Tax=Saguinus oedipus TaxID=9490 RepID=A0ABQ9VH10_SAGOE|nr:hypothetical protein P7K49_013640 [Saguinus oedipus]